MKFVRLILRIVSNVLKFNKIREVRLELVHRGFRMKDIMQCAIIGKYSYIFLSIALKNDEWSSSLISNF